MKKREERRERPDECLGENQPLPSSDVNIQGVHCGVLQAKHHCA